MNKLAFFLDEFPEYHKTLRLAVTHEESGKEPRSYQGWQSHDVETHPTKLIRLVTEGISTINLLTRQATSDLPRERGGQTGLSNLEPFRKKVNRHYRLAPRTAVALKKYSYSHRKFLE